MFGRMIGYVEDKGILGEVARIDFVNQVVILMEDEHVEFHPIDIDDVEFLKEAFVLHDTVIFNKDVLGDIFGARYLVERHEDGEVTLHSLDESLQIKTSGAKFKVTESIAEDFEEMFDLAGNYYELINAKPKEPTFNIQIVKEGKSHTYYYACNSKGKKEIDLIKVIFMGSTLIKEEEHERKTISYQEYMEAVASGVYQEVSPQELHNYVTGVTYNKEDSVDEGIDWVECGVSCGCNDDECVIEEANDIEDAQDNSKNCEAPVICDKCYQSSSQCDCDLWD